MPHYAGSVNVLFLQRILSLDRNLFDFYVWQPEQAARQGYAGSVVALQQSSRLSPVRAAGSCHQRQQGGPVPYPSFTVAVHRKTFRAGAAGNR